MKSNALKTTLGLLSASLLAGCGGDDPSTGSVPVGTLSYDTRTGIMTDGSVDDTSIPARFLDADVENLQYKSISYDGTTTLFGRFNCASGEDVEFLIGSLSLGTATCQGIITPQTLAAKKTWKPVTATITSASGGGGGTIETYQETLAKTPITNAEVINRVRLLMSLDRDLDATNGIFLPDQQDQNAVTIESVDFANTANFEATVKTEVLTKLGISTNALVDATEAENHFTNTVIQIENDPAHISSSGKTKFYNRSNGLYVDSDQVAIAITNAEKANNNSNNKGYGG